MESFLSYGDDVELPARMKGWTVQGSDLLVGSSMVNKRKDLKRRGRLGKITDLHEKDQGVASLSNFMGLQGQVVVTRGKGY